MHLLATTTWSKLCGLTLAGLCAVAVGGCQGSIEGDATSAGAGMRPGSGDTGAIADPDAVETVNEDVDGVIMAVKYKKANLTNFESYPDPDSDECKNYNGCLWEGQFAFVDGKKSESWVKAHNIVAVHEKDANKYALKKLRLKQGGKSIDVTVYDECADSDCNGCCTKNSKQTKFLIDIEKYTMQRFGSGDGIVQWACLNCN
jgi:hypothetical protein